MPDHRIERAYEIFERVIGRALTVVALATGIVFLFATARAEGPVAGDLLAEIETIRTNMPGSGDEGFATPSSTDLDTWQTIMQALLDDQPATAGAPIAAFPSYELITFCDTGFEDKQYYVLREPGVVVRGWGTFIVSPDFEREIAIEVPHPLFETNTPSEGADIFRRTRARFFLMSGAHRCSNAAHSTCDGTSNVCGDGVYHVSDMAHIVASAYQVAHEVFTDKYAQGYTFSLHGTGQAVCNDIFLSNGIGSDSKPILHSLRDAMNASGNIVVSVAGDGTSTCTLTGSTNVQGRYTNGSTDPCQTSVVSNSGYFIHAEQQRRVRDDFAIYSKFTDAINATIAPTPVSPMSFGRLKALYRQKTRSTC